MTYDMTALEELEQNGLVAHQDHPTTAFSIYNYTARAQFDGKWTALLRACRGLILTPDGGVVERPFPKFFNLGERQDETLPDLPFDVWEKMDGSLGILYWPSTVPSIASRGSFCSPQALKATEILHTRYCHVFDAFKRDCTYLFEIVYPENRVIVDYGQTEDLFLLAVIDKETGAALPVPDVGFPMPKRYDGAAALDDLAKQNVPNAEGYVVRFQNGYRVKVKFEEYRRLHKLLTGVSAKTVWECMRQGQDIGRLLESVPDEFFVWVRDLQARLQAEFDAIAGQCRADFAARDPKTFGDRKATAEYFKTCDYPAMLFNMLDARPCADLIWRAVKPKGERPFKMADEATA